MKSDQIPPNVMLFLKTTIFAGYKVKLHGRLTSLAAQSMCHIILVILWFFIVQLTLAFSLFSSCSLKGGSSLDTF